MWNSKVQDEKEKEKKNNTTDFPISKRKKKLRDKEVCKVRFENGFGGGMGMNAG